MVHIHTSFCHREKEAAAAVNKVELKGKKKKKVLFPLFHFLWTRQVMNDICL